MANTETTNVLSHSEIEKICLELSNSNKINKTNSWGLKLTDCLPEIINIDSDTPEEVDITKTNFQRFSCSIEVASKIYSHRVDSLHDLAFHFNKSLTTNEEERENNEGEPEPGQEEAEDRVVHYRRIVKSNTIEEDETKLSKSLKDIAGIYTDPMFIHMRRNLKDYASDYISDTISVYYTTYWRGPYITTTDDVVEPLRSSQLLHPLTTTNGEPIQAIVIDDELVTQTEQIGDNTIIDGNNEQINDDDHMMLDGNNDEHGDLQLGIQLNLDNYLLLNDDYDDEGDKSISDSFFEESISESKKLKGGRDRSYQRPSASNASRLLLPENDGPSDKNQFLTTFLKPRLITSKTMNGSTIPSNQQDRVSNHLNPHNNNNNDDDDDDDEENNEIPTREGQFASIRELLDKISKERGSVGLVGVADSTSMSKKIVDQLNYARTAKHIDLKLLKKELKQAIDVRRESSRQLIDFQALLTSMGRRLSEEMIEQCSISYYFISVLHLCNENNWELISSGLNGLIVNTAEK